MTSRRSTAAILMFALATLALRPPGAGALGFEAITLGFSQAWTGNAYTFTPEGELVTGTETTPIDPFVSVGVRVGLLDGLLASGAVLSVMPALEVGVRRYVLLESGRVVPAPFETKTGAEGNTPGRGAAQVVTVRLPLPIAYELRFLERHAAFMTIAPTFVFRILAGGESLRDDVTDLSQMYSFFYGSGRFVMPEIAVGYRLAVSDFLDVTLRATYGASVADLLDTTLPWYHENRVSVGVDVGFRPPFGGLFREREGELPRDVEPFPEENE